jgi:hypothetical protein
MPTVRNGLSANRPFNTATPWTALAPDPGQAKPLGASEDFLY